MSSPSNGDLQSTLTIVTLAWLGLEVIKKIILDLVFPKADILSKDEKDRIISRQTAVLSSIDGFSSEHKALVKGLESLSTSLENTNSKIESIFQISQIKDNDGVPLCFFPRSWHETLKETLNATKEISSSQKDIAALLSATSKTLEKLSDRVK